MNERYLLKGGTVVTAGHVFAADARLDFGRVAELGDDLKAKRGETVVDCSEYLIFPGLINAHDHLSLNLFPHLGHPPYANSYEWGKDIHARLKASIEDITRIPLRERLFWGAWKNLFSGVTCVVHHDPYSFHFQIGYPVRVLKRYTFAHSLGFEPDMRRTLNRRLKNVPFVIHLAEGIDDQASTEVKRLCDMGGLDDRTVAVHVVGIGEADAEILHTSNASVVWCPASNAFLFDKTAPMNLLGERVRIAIGTDSTLTGSVTLFGEMHAARQAYPFTPKQLFAMVTESPRRIFRMPNDLGTVVEGGRADVFLVKSTKASPYAALIDAQPGDIAALFVGGSLQFYDSSLDTHLPQQFSCSEVHLNGRTKRVRSKSFGRRYDALKPYLKHYQYLN